MIRPTTFEQACTVHGKIVTGDALRTRGVAPVMDEYRVALAALGWTIEALGDEAARRMRVRIAELRVAEKNGTSQA